MEKERSKRNKTLTISPEEAILYKERLLFSYRNINLESLINKTICGNSFDVIEYIPKKIVDLVILDPPYNLNKKFQDLSFSQIEDDSYIKYIESWFPKILQVLKPSGSVYLCGDWRSSSCLYIVMKKYLKVRNRIIWQREKGRGAKQNWKNSCEDIWFGTLSNQYYFNVNAVKQKRKVIAPYKENGKPKDWEQTQDGNFRLTYPSNFWDDISIPYWSMSENTPHPTQKPEKLLAKLILASCPQNGIVLDPFLGSGTTSVVAKKLGRRYIGIELNQEYCIWAEKRLEQANTDATIQGYSEGIFWERNTAHLQLRNKSKKKHHKSSLLETYFEQ